MSRVGYIYNIYIYISLCLCVYPEIELLLNILIGFSGLNKCLYNVKWMSYLHRKFEDYFQSDDYLKIGIFFYYEIANFQ